MRSAIMVGPPSWWTSCYGTCHRQYNTRNHFADKISHTCLPAVAEISRCRGVSEHVHTVALKYPANYTIYRRDGPKAVQ